MVHVLRNLVACCLFVTLIRSVYKPQYFFLSDEFQVMVLEAVFFIYYSIKNLFLCNKSLSDFFFFTTASNVFNFGGHRSRTISLDYLRSWQVSESDGEGVWGLDGLCSRWRAVDSGAEIQSPEETAHKASRLQAGGNKETRVSLPLQSLASLVCVITESKPQRVNKFSQQPSELKIWKSDWFFSSCGSSAAEGAQGACQSQPR